MRLIDADVLKTKLFTLGILYPLHEKVIDETAFQEPIVHGYWGKGIVKDEPYEFIGCSVCKNEAFWDTDYGQQLFDYCPYCGAKMDEVIEDDSMAHSERNSKCGTTKVIVCVENGDMFSCSYDECIDDDSKFGFWESYYDPITPGFLDSEFKSIPESEIMYWMYVPEFQE